MHERIKQEQTRILYTHRLTVLLGSFAIGLISTIVLWQETNRQLLSIWFAALVILVAIRWRLSNDYQQQSRKEQDTRYQYWAIQFAAGSFLTGVLWGIVPWVFYTENVHFFALILVMHAGFISGAASATSIHLPTFLAFVIPSSVLFFVGTLLNGGLEFWPHAMLIIVYANVILIFAMRNNRSLLEQVTLRLENADLLADLRSQRDKAEQAMLAKNRFLAAASHDLRQPVHALGLFVSSLETKDDPEQRQYILSKIKQSTAALGSLFHGLLDISKLDANVLKNNPENTNLDELMLLIETQFQYTALEKGLAFNIPTATGHTAFVDDALLERILRNLVSNAINYTKKGQVSITIEPFGSNKLKIAVRDTGTGIEEEEQENIFSEYHQLENPERDRQKGLGLGLAIVRRLCELMEIPIHVESEPDKGSTFSLIVVKGNQLEHKSTAAKSTVLDHLPLTVIVIDDELDIIDGMQRVLRNWQCTTFTATSTVEALATLAGEDAPDVIIADFRLRGNESGLDAIRVIREEFNCDIPAILITGDTAPERLQQAASASVQVLHKPVEPAVLRQVLDALAHNLDKETA